MNNNNISDKIASKDDKVTTQKPKKNRKIIIFFIIIFILAIFILDKILPNNKGTEPPKTTQSTDKFTPSVDSDIPNTYNSDVTYYLNQVVNSKIPVNGFSWKGDKLIYSTPDGIFEGGTNKAVSRKKISEIKWIPGFKALVKSIDGWYLFDYDGIGFSKINYSFQNPILSNDFSFIADRLNGKIVIYNLQSKSATEKTNKIEVENLLIDNSNNQLLVSIKDNNNTVIYKLDKELKEIESKKFNGKYLLSSVVPKSNRFILTSENKLIVADFNETYYTDTFLDNSKIFTYFINNYQYLSVEQYQDTLGRTLENIYLSSVSGGRFKISDSKPIINRINLNIPFESDEKSQVVAFAQNKGKTWLLSLKPDYIATYSTEGSLVFTKLESGGI